MAENGCFPLGLLSSVSAFNPSHRQDVDSVFAADFGRSSLEVVFATIARLGKIKRPFV